MSMHAILKVSMEIVAFCILDAWQRALKTQPDIITIMLGTNGAESFNWEGVQQDTGD
jgi:lysophospholipase L1-like esterase